MSPIISCITLWIMGIVLPELSLSLFWRRGIINLDQIVLPVAIQSFRLVIVGFCWLDMALRNLEAPVNNEVPWTVKRGRKTEKEIMTEDEVDQGDNQPAFASLSFSRGLPCFLIEFWILSTMVFATLICSFFTEAFSSVLACGRNLCSNDRTDLSSGYSDRKKRIAD